jgi:hypothetical protein
MGMATVPPWDRTEARLRFAVTAADEHDRRNLTCLFCGSGNVEWTTTWSIGGRRVWVGLHEHCIQACGEHS